MMSTLEKRDDVTMYYRMFDYNVQIQSFPTMKESCLTRKMVGWG